MRIYRLRVAAGALAAGLALTAAWCGGEGQCRNYVRERLPSPDGTLEAVRFDLGCGATTGLSPQVAVVQRGTPPAAAPGNAFFGQGAWQQITVRWRGPRELEIVAPDGATVRAPSEASGVRVIHLRAPMSWEVSDSSTARAP